MYSTQQYSEFSKLTLLVTSIIATKFLNSSFNYLEIFITICKSPLKSLKYNNLLFLTNFLK